MKIQFYGAAGTVTGSQIVLTTKSNKKILIDCGMFQGNKEESHIKNETFGFNPSEIDFCVLTHAHIDHSGNLPNLVKQGFKNPIFATIATVELCNLLLKDSAHIQELDIEYYNRIRKKKNLQPLCSLYTANDVNNTMKLFVGMPYNKKFQLTQDIVAEFIDAGHILGSSSIVLTITEDNKTYKMGFSGDIGHSKLPIMNEPNKLRDVNYLIIESTYGNSLHSDLFDVEEQIVKIIKKTMKLGGNIIIPAFAVGRVQLLVYILHKLFQENRIPEIPIFVDSPMAFNATTIYNKYIEDLNPKLIEKFQGTENIKPFEFGRLEYILTSDRSKSLMNLKFPHIIISCSGMLEGGRVLHHIKNNLENSKSVILFVGYSAEHTLARTLLNGVKKLKLFRKTYDVRCKIKSLDAFSAHADKNELLDYVSINKPEDLKTIFINHGESLQSKNLKKELSSKNYKNIIIAEPYKEYEL